MNPDLAGVPVVPLVPLVPHRRAEDRSLWTKFGLATRTVLPPLFAVCGMIVFLYHGLGIHALIVHGTVAQATEEPGTIDLLIYLSSVATAFGAKHFDALASAIANRISLVKQDVTAKVTGFQPHQWASGEPDAGVL